MLGNRFSSSGPPGQRLANSWLVGLPDKWSINISQTEPQPLEHLSPTKRGSSAQARTGAQVLAARQSAQWKALRAAFLCRTPPSATLGTSPCTPFQIVAGKSEEHRQECLCHQRNSRSLVGQSAASLGMTTKRKDCRGAQPFGSSAVTDLLPPEARPGPMSGLRRSPSDFRNRGCGTHAR